MKTFRTEFTNKLIMPSYVYSCRPAFLYMALTQFCFITLNIYSANMTFSGTWIIPAIRGNNLQGHSVGLVWRLDLVLFCNALVYLVFIFIKVSMLKKMQFWNIPYYLSTKFPKELDADDYRVHLLAPLPNNSLTKPDGIFGKILRF